MTRDRHGNPLSGADARAAEAYDTAVVQFGTYRGDPLGVLDAALREAPRMVMGHAAKAWLMAVATEPAATAEGRRVVESARALPADEREASHLAALALDGRWDDAALALDRHNARWPRDILALQAGHLADFFRGNARSLRDRIARVLPHWSADTPGGPLVLGMYAFGLEEMGDYAGAEDAGRRALDAEPYDCWAHHAVTHVLEMQGRAEDGVAWMASRERYWAGEDNFFKIHNHWHRALFHLDLGQPQAALALYDDRVRKTRSAVAVDLVDASALLWRLHLLGHDVGDRWRELAEAWLAHADGRSYPFNDWHAVMACLGAGRDADVTRIEADMRAAAAEATSVAEWIRTSGLPLVQGFRAFWRGDYAAATEQLLPARAIANRFGGSHAQRDVIDWTLTEAALRAGQDDLAAALAHERLALKPGSPVNLGFASRARPGRAV
jgi:tetratricopeptide (TPR) repeat protein